jgi:hypothetical protein
MQSSLASNLRAIEREFNVAEYKPKIAELTTLLTDVKIALTDARIPEHLPRRYVVHERSCTCPACGGEMRKVGEDVTEILDYVSGHFEVINHIRPVFSSRRCERMVQTPMPLAAD